jgi:hypothetical protein
MGINGGQRPVSIVVGGFNRSYYEKSYLGYSAGIRGGLLVAETQTSTFFLQFFFGILASVLFTLHSPIF